MTLATSSSLAHILMLYGHEAQDQPYVHVIQVLSIFDRMITASLLKVLRHHNVPQAAGPAKQAGEDVDMDDGEAEEGPSSSAGGSQQQQQCAAVISNLATLLQEFGLRDQPDTLRTFADSFAEIARSPSASEAVVEACFKVLMALVRPIHGSLRETSAMVLRQLTAGVLGLAEARAGSADTSKAGSASAPDRRALAIRERILQFANDVVQHTSAAKDAVAALARHVILKAPDRAEYRALAAEAAVALVAHLPAAEQHTFVMFVARLSRTPKVSQRLLAVELAPVLLHAFPDPFAPSAIIEAPVPSGTPASTRGRPEVPNTGSTSRGTPAAAEDDAQLPEAEPVTAAGGQAEPAGAPATWGMVCIAVLVQRCSDKAAAVRGKALGHLASVITTLAPGDGGDAPSQRLFRQALALANSVRMASPLSGQTPAIISPPVISPANAEDPTGTPMDDNTPAGIAMRNAAMGTGAQAHKKKRGLHRALLESAFQTAARGNLSTADLDVEPLVHLARRRSGDEKAGVRKAALQLLEALLVLKATGVGGADPELPTEADITAIEAATADALVTVRKVGLSAASRLLRELPYETAMAELWVRAALPMVRDVEASMQEQLLDQFHDLIIARAATAAATGRDKAPTPAALAAAALLRPILADPSAPSWLFLQECWQRLKQREAGSGADEEGALLLRVIANAAARFPPDQAAQLAADLLQAVRTFALPPAAAAAHVAALSQLSQAQNSGEQAGQLGTMDAWGGDVCRAAEGLLGGYVEHYGESAARANAAMTPEDWQAATALFIVGEVALLRSCKPSGRLVVLVQALTSPKLASAPSAASQQGASQAFSEGSEVPGAVQAHAWVTLGKLCLTDEPLAKKCVPLLVQELRRASTPAVRNNIMVALADLCIQYTALVDTHVPRLAACLSDPNELVRRQALALLANLLQKDYVKWRGPLFHRFLLALVDDSPSVCALAEFLLGDTLASKAPLLAYNHFVESLFVLNDCRAGLHGGGVHAAAMAQADELPASQGEPGEPGANLKGASPRARAKRGAIYKALLRRMAPEHKFATAAKLCSEVLGGVADGLLPLEECEGVLGDTLRILASKHIKVSTSRAAADEEEPSAASVVGAAKGKLVSAMMKKHLVEGVVPVLIELKRLLEGLRHHLLGDLMTCIRALLKDYKTEIEDILVGDKQLAKEIMYDMRQADAARQAAAKSAAAATAGGPAGPSAAAADPLDAASMLPAAVPAQQPQQQGASGRRNVGNEGGSGADGPHSMVRPAAAPAEGSPWRSASKARPGSLPAGVMPGSAPAHPISSYKTPHPGSSQPSGAAAGEPGSASRTDGGGATAVGTPLSVPRLRTHGRSRGSASPARTAALKQVEAQASRLKLTSTAAPDTMAFPDENASDPNRPADIVLPSPDRPHTAKPWNVPPETSQSCGDALDEAPANDRGVSNGMAADGLTAKQPASGQGVPAAWRRGPEGKERLCNACGVRFLHKGSLEGYFPKFNDEDDHVSSASGTSQGGRKQAADGGGSGQAGEATSWVELVEAAAKLGPDNWRDVASLVHRALIAASQDPACQGTSIMAELQRAQGLLWANREAGVKLLRELLDAEVLMLLGGLSGETAVADTGRSHEPARASAEQDAKASPQPWFELLDRIKKVKAGQADAICMLLDSAIRSASSDPNCPAQVVPALHAAAVTLETVSVLAAKRAIASVREAYTPQWAYCSECGKARLATRRLPPWADFKCGDAAALLPSRTCEDAQDDEQDWFVPDQQPGPRPAAVSGVVRPSMVKVANSHDVAQTGPSSSGQASSACPACNQNSTGRLTTAR
ncbi:hypothetical protein WJX72_011494 [[Myrmecia] bisecta]|uniref:Condensin complex subunit 1 C-terminal domain-containing protein n=1 Tax=[Myrmecia] bisecta TaxID=41462 RepID=A0AAW1PXB0_9CHLO